MSPRELIAEAWHITIKYKRILLPWGALEAFVILIAAIGFVSYQGYVLWIFFQTGEISSWQAIFQGVGSLFQSHTWLAIALTIAALIFCVLWILIPRFATGALIGLAAKIHTGDEPKGGLVFAVFNFLHLLELAAALALIDGKTIFSAWSLFIRYMGAADVIFTTTGALILVWLTSFVFHFFFMFAEEAIVIRKLGIFCAIGHSFKLVISYLGRIVLIGILLLVIILRIIVNAIIIFLIPLIVMGLGFLLARFLPEIVSFSISGSIGLIAVIFASYFLGYVTVFKNTVWTITYLELSKERELDLIAVKDEPKEEEETQKEPQEEGEVEKA